MNTLTFGGKTRKPRKDSHKLFMERSYRFITDHTRKLNEAAFGKDKAKWPDTLLALPYDVAFLRVEMNKVVGVKHCRYCGVKLTAKNISLDHCIPVKRRDEFSSILEPFASESVMGVPVSRYVGLVSNPRVVPMLLAAYSWPNTDIQCCIKCNKQKGEMTAVDFAKLCECLLTLTPNSAAYVRRQLALMPTYQFRFSKKERREGIDDEAF